MALKKNEGAILLLLAGIIVIGILITPSVGASAEIVPIVGEYYAVPWEVIDTQLILNTTEPIGAIHLRVDYNSSVCNITSVAQDGFDVLMANTEHASEGWIEFICYQTGAAGGGNTTFTFSTQAVCGDYGTKTTLNVTVITLKNNIGYPMIYNVINATFRVALKGDFSGDMDVDAWDISYLARHLIGLAGYEGVCSGEVSGDGVLDSYDCTYLVRKLLGLV